MAYEIVVDAPYLSDMMAQYQAQGKSDREAADMVIAGLSLSGDKLPTLLTALKAYRATLFEERTVFELPLVAFYPDDPIPPLDELDDKLFRVGMLHDRLQAEYVRRQVAPKSDAKPDALPTAFDGDPKL